MATAGAARSDETAPHDRAPQGVDRALRAVADPTRRSILRLVRDDEQPAGAIADRFPTMSRPAVSQHLRVLADAGLVEMRRDGNRRLYRARPEGLEEIWAVVDEMWASGLHRLKAAAESDHNAIVAREERP